MDDGFSAEDSDWIQANVIAVPVPLSGRWWIEEDEVGLDVA